MAFTLAFVNQKGGVGKTTSALHLAAAVADMGYRVLLCDVDPQGNLASGMGFRKSDLRKTVYNVFCGESVKNCAVKTKIPRLDALFSHLDLVGVETELSTAEGKNSCLREAFAEVSADYDYIFLDCPPSLSLLTVNALVAADAILVPLCCDFYSLEGLSQLQISVKKIRDHYNSHLQCVGFLVTMWDGRTNLSRQVLEELEKHYGERLFKTKISRSVRLAEAPSFGETVFVTAPESRSAKEYRAAAKELMLRV